MIHEVLHGLMALKLGDTTAKDQGRLTLNPLKHIDPFGSVVVPLVLLVTGSPILIGWAKPVMYNPANIKNPKTGDLLIKLAGPASNLALAVVFGLILRLLFPFVNVPIFGSLVIFLKIIVATNVSLAIFNLVPLPPLDGSSILFALIPDKWHALQEFLTRHGFWLLIIFIFFGFQLILPIIGSIYLLLTGPAG
ncbi:MAG: site-2 protease family protein [bacterium]|nr:site-2 protease family protein [bacterium]